MFIRFLSITLFCFTLVSLVSSNVLNEAKAITNQLASHLTRDRTNDESLDNLIYGWADIYDGGKVKKSDFLKKVRKGTYSSLEGSVDESSISHDFGMNNVYLNFMNEYGRTLFTLTVGKSPTKLKIKEINFL
ncbi:hypothetical protein DFH28DRAFT_931607 [Melampsora americana]|nr:hypothetical protein DFH28DRAFT_931607 [Melampsora americana]